MSVLHFSEIQQIDSTMPQFAALKDKYPYAVLNAADNWEETPFPVGYVPRTIDVYYGDDVLEPSLSVENGNLTSLKFPNEEESLTPVTQIDVDGRWAFIEVEGVVLLNHLEGVVLPEVLVDTSVIASAVGLS